MYTCLSHSFVEDQEGYKLISIRQEDMESIRLWRNAQIDILRQNDSIAADEQQNYFKSEIKPSFTQNKPRQILFSFLYKQALIGYGGLTNIDWYSCRAEVSFLVDPKRINELSTYPIDFTHFLGLLCRVAFGQLSFHRLYTETFDFRDSHMHILEKFGFIHEGVLREHIFKKGQWHHSIMHGLLATDKHYEK